MLVFVHAYCIITQVSMYALESNKMIIYQNQTLIKLCPFSISRRGGAPC